MPEDKGNLPVSSNLQHPRELTQAFQRLGFEVFIFTPQAKTPVKCLFIGPLSTPRKEHWSNSRLNTNIKIK